MNILPNLFARGFGKFRITKQLVISHGDYCPPVVRPLHNSQEYLDDAELLDAPCIFCDDFVVVTVKAERIREGLRSQCTTAGKVWLVVYEVTGTDLEGHPVHTSNLYSRQDAEDIVRSRSNTF
ncbi:hypothetical protein [Azotobacter vinelandii]|uniref:hypothetical protein n=1 Tax=Azotobacter vinelandii TaxID=354 RepID=UPI000921F74A|nr:hypothetical protein [Azotobacter vinelandii]WKN23178.1 hypothetical protein AVAEIV_001214 [Azotobacter vinelandii]SFY09251.1 hypothetical protein SAMN04244547_03956 [Azotobacter vinelandii]